MNARSILRLLGVLITLSSMTAAQAQGFAGLATSADGFAVPKPGTMLTFPADHGAHPDFRIEWWYLTANLKAADGTAYGVQWTLFRSAMAPGEAKGWASPQIWMGHAALTTPTQHFVSERLSRGGIGQAGVVASPFAAWIDDWHMQQSQGLNTPSGPGDALASLDLAASGPDFGYAMSLEAKGPLVLHGENGYSVKSASGQASEYYSQPGYTISGTLSLPGGDVPVTGEGWLDREWSSQPLSADQTGWDWFSLHFDSGEKLMGFRLRDSGAGFTSGTFITPDGRATPLKPGELTVTPLETATVAGRSLPVSWRLDIPTRKFSVTTTALNRNAWMATSFPYWEGPIRFEGSNRGVGYLEMTGY